MTTTMKALSLWQPWASLCVIPRPCATCFGSGVADMNHTSSAVTLCSDCPGPFKTIETRSWPAPKSLIGQRIAIHAAARQPVRMEIGPFEVWPRDPKRSQHPNHPDGRPARMYRNDVKFMALAHWSALPLGAVVGTAVLADCVPMVEDVTDLPFEADCIELSGQSAYLWRAGKNEPERSVREQLPFGHFEPGRWAWLLTDVERFDEPIPATGRQGIWNWERP